MKDTGVVSYGETPEEVLLFNLTYTDDSEDEAEAALEAFCGRFRFGLCLLMGLVCVLGVLGNVVSLVVLGKHKAEPTSIFILQVLSLSDAILLLTSLLLYVPEVFEMSKAASRVLHKVQIYTWPLSLMAHTVTVWVTVLLTLNRYHAVVTLVRSANSLARMRIKVLVVILLSILYNVPRFFEHHVVRIDWVPDDEENINATTSNKTMNNTEIAYKEKKIYLGEVTTYQIGYSIILYYPVMYIVPFFCLAYLNTKLMFALKDIKKKRQAITGHKVKEDHVTVIVIVIVIAFICCQTPALVNQIFWSTLEYRQRKCGYFHFYYTRVSDLLVVLNSSANFAIYCLFGKTFRQVFLSTICPRDNRDNANEISVHRPNALKLKDTIHMDIIPSCCETGMPLDN